MRGKAALVVGGSGGLGSAICRTLAADWQHIVVAYRRNAEAATRLAAEIGPDAMAVCCDLLDFASVSAAVEKAGAAGDGLGAIIFASGVSIAQPFVAATTESQWREVIETELMGFTRLVGAALPHFRASGGGVIVALSSVANYAYPPGDALSSVPKAAIESLCRAIAKEEGRYAIRANAVAPGVIDAGLGASYLRELYDPAIWEKQRRRIALQRFGTDQEIADAVAFLASDRARYVTGQTLIVDGGFSL